MKTSVQSLPTRFPAAGQNACYFRGQNAIVAKNESIY